jgi:endonuclease YncB( thermonuclease family)
MKGYRLVKGEFHLFYQKTRRVGSQPDGDSVWFKPNDTKQLENLGNRSANYTAGGFVQLRFEGIDCLETHFQGAHQNWNDALAARNFNLKYLGFKDVQYSGQTGLTVASATPHPIPGYILTRGIDPYGRPVSFVVPGHSTKKDGANVILTAQDLKKTVNAQLAAAGQTYPGFYNTMPTDLRNYLSSLSQQARRGKKGLWRTDASLKGATVTSLDDLEQFRIWPKFFRRLVAFLKDKPSDFSKFDAWLRAKPSERDDDLWIISRGEAGNLHDVYRATAHRIKMLYDPHDLVITPH